MNEVRARIGTAVRFLVLAVLLMLSVVLGRSDDVRPLVEILVVAAVVSTLSLTTRIRQDLLAVVEGVAASLAVVLASPDCVLALPYLLVPVLVAGMRATWVVPAVTLVAEAATIALVWWRTDTFSGSTTLDSAGRNLMPFALVALAALPVGLIGIAIGRVVRRRTEDDQTNYRNAISLISQLDALSSRLSRGLDPVHLAEEIMTDADVSLPVQQAVVYARGAKGRVYPLRYSEFSAPSAFGDVEELVEQVWSTERLHSRDLVTAIPVRSPERTVAVLVVQLTHEAESSALERLQASVRDRALQLQAALLFDNVRATATSEERNRLAREVHDGVAQDIASLGYVIDSIAAQTRSTTQHDRLVALRTEVTRVVAELRASVYDLRNEMRAGEGLGQGVSAYARQIGSRSDLTVHVRLDEGATRLRPELEAELLRIAQEAMNNARKHSEGRNLWVSCTVRPPRVEIEVVDDGAGMQPPREDSQGLRIMRERAERVGAVLDVGARDSGPGTRLSVRLPSA
ncbi:hypothetical protein GCM10011519_01130 [Marmoricola endophyticus]|uniref:Histidine kinase/HSP90-like ATPase domain-containing protein n=1 Tax=Marmoricola endophyticus TaxID=2040280 RepID=A0A917F050_9ACTN|nr:ATP-binding protein [Marmoricola endophyticus]GGF31553.1 hypothetical protein GCM10011519_01130 [Marmoricola endophyticus]